MVVLSDNIDLGLVNLISAKIFVMFVQFCDLHNYVLRLGPCFYQEYEDNVNSLMQIV